MLDAAILSLHLLLSNPGSGCVCPCPTPQSDGPGESSLLRRPQREAYALNRQGRDLYRQRRFEEARGRYRRALAADPGFVAPRLNIACALVQEGELEAGVAEAVALAEAAYVPWGAEIERAADLAPLRAHPTAFGRLEQGLRRAAARWAIPLEEAVLFVARTGKPVKLPPEGVLHLGLEQEVFAFLPRSGTYRQVTADDGRVLAFAPNPDRSALLYLRSGKLVRARGQPPRLRALSIRHLDLRSLKVGEPIAVPGDATSVSLGFDATTGAFVVGSEGQGGTKTYRLEDRGLVSFSPGSTRRPAPLVVLTAQSGVSPAKRHTEKKPCRLHLQERRPGGQAPELLIRGPGQRPFPLAAPEGAGLFGLPWP